MKSSLIFLGWAFIAVSYGVASAESNGLQESALQSSARRNYKRARQLAQILGERVPSGPPVKISNAHSGVMPLASRQSFGRSRQEIIKARSSSRNQKPVAIQSSNPGRYRRRMRRRRRPVARARKSPIGKQLMARKRSRAAVPVQTVEKVMTKEKVVEEKPSHRFARKIVEGMLKSVRGGAGLIGARGNYGPVPLIDKLIDNATLIRENLVEGFNCTGMRYGYYADQLNDCQVFHVCVNMEQIFPSLYTAKDTYHFSFICPKYTIFSQDSMVCASNTSAVPCGEAHKLYYMNQNFFVVSNDDNDVKKTSAGYTSAPSNNYPASSGGSYPTSSAGSYPTSSAGSYPASSTGGQSTASPSGYPTAPPASPQTASTGGYPTAVDQTAGTKGPLPGSFLVEEAKAPLPDSTLINSGTGDSDTAPPTSAPPSSGPATIGGGSYPTPEKGGPRITGPLTDNPVLEEDKPTKIQAKPGPLPDSVQI